MQLILTVQVLIHQYAYGDREGLRTDVAGHVEDQGLEAYNHWQDSYDVLKRTDDGGDSDAEKQQDYQPRQALFHALFRRFVEVLFRGQTCELCVVLAQLVIDGLDNILRGNDTDDLLALIQDRQRILGIVLYLLDAFRDLLVIQQVRVSIAYERVQLDVLARHDEVFEIDRAAEAFLLVDYVYSRDVVVFTGLLH